MPTSSTVWCRSTSRSPVASIAQVEPAVLAELLEHVVEERDAGRRASRCPPPSTSSARSIVVSFVSRCCCDDPAHQPAHLRERASRSAARNASFSSGVPTVTRRHSCEAWPAREVAHEHPAVDERAARARGRRRARGAARSWRPTGTTVTPSIVVELRRRAAPAPRPASATRSSISDPSASASTPGDLGRRRRGGTGARPSRAPRPPTAARPQKPSRSAAIDHTFEYVRATTSGRSSATSSIALRSANSPYASSTTTRPSVASSERLDRGARARRCRSGCWGCTGTRSSGRCSATSARAAAASIVKSARALADDDLGAGDASDVRVQRVRGLEHRRAVRPARRR